MDDIDVGDFVRDPRGKIWKVLSSTGLPARLCCSHTMGDRVDREEFWEYNVKLVLKACKKEEKVAEKTLYEIKDGDVIAYGYKLAVNSQGQWVMEIKGSGAVISVSKTQVTEVMPYTIGLQFAEGGTIYHYFNEARGLVAGDALVMPGYSGAVYQVAIVKSVDTKSKSATKEISYVKKLA